MGEVKKRVSRKKKGVQEPYYGHGAAKIMRMKKAGFSIPEQRKMKK